MVAGAVTALLALAGLAEAKPLAEVEVAGPGLEAPIVLGQNGAAEYANWIVGHGEEEAPPRGDIGPRYTMRLELGVDDRTIVQHLYPFAPEQPLVYTPPSQHAYRGEAPLRHGWAAADPSLMGLLRRRGLPRSRPVVEGATPARPVPGSGSVPWSIAVVGVTFSLAVLVGLRLRRAALARTR